MTVSQYSRNSLTSGLGKVLILSVKYSDKCPLYSASSWLLGYSRVGLFTCPHLLNWGPASTYCVYTTQGLVLIVPLSFSKYHPNWPNNVKEIVLRFHKGKFYAKERLDKVDLLK